MESGYRLHGRSSHEIAPIAAPSELVRRGPPHGSANSHRVSAQGVRPSKQPARPLQRKSKSRNAAPLKVPTPRGIRLKFSPCSHASCRPRRRVSALQPLKFTCFDGVLGMVRLGENPEDSNPEQPWGRGGNQKQPQNQNSLPVEFAELTTSHGQLHRVLPCLFLLPVFTGNSFPAHPRTTVDYFAHCALIGERCASHVHRTVCFCGTSGEFSCGIWRVRCVHWVWAFRLFATP